MEHEEESKLAIAWFKTKDIEAYSDGGGLVYVVMDNEDETHILVSNSEISYRAELQAEEQ